MSTRHQIIEQLGSGGFGTVYRAKDTQLNREIAIKRLKASEGSNRSDLMSNLLEEAKILAALRHPNIVTIYDIQSSDDHAEIIMELVKGITIEQLVKRHLLLARDFIFITTQILSALSVAHKHNVLHCDLKPSNLMLCATQGDNYEIKIVDFGMSPSASNITGQTTKIIGSIYFMAPEQLDKGTVSVQTDIYSLGCLFYYMLTGSHPFDGDTTVQVMASHMLGNFKPVASIRQDLPVELCSWVEKHIAKNPEDRFQSCKDSLNELISLQIDSATEAFKINASTKSRKTAVDVRPITVTSLTPEEKPAAQPKKDEEKKAEFELPPHAAKLAEKHQKEFEATQPKKVAPKKEPKALAEQVIRIAPNSIWYFTIKGQRRGPIPLESIGGLIENNQLRGDDSVWHPAFDDWKKVSDCEELQPYLEKVAEANKPAKPTLKQKLFGKGSEAEDKGIIARFFDFIDGSISTELLITLFGTLVCGAFIWLKPDIWQFATIAFAIVLFIYGYLNLKYCQIKSDLLWLIAGISLPLFGDLLFTLTHVRIGAKGFLLMLLGLSIMLYTIMQMA